MKKSSSSIGLPGVLFLIFLVLKLTGNINWSWWWVTSPLWIPFTIVLFLIVIIGFVILLFLSFGVPVSTITDKIKKLKND